MLRRPSSRHRKQQEQIQLNLVPILDAMVTLIAFLLYTMSFLSIVTIESPLPQSSAEINSDKLDQRPLQLTLSIREKDSEIWSPFDRIEPRRIPHLEAGKPDVRQLHEAFLALKQQFPQERQLVLAPNAGLAYDQLVAVMDAARNVAATDPTIYARDVATGTDQAVKLLFPDIVFGNLLGGDGA